MPEEELHPIGYLLLDDVGGNNCCVDDWIAAWGNSG